MDGVREPFWRARQWLLRGWSYDELAVVRCMEMETLPTDWVARWRQIINRS